MPWTGLGLSKLANTVNNEWTHFVLVKRGDPAMEPVRVATAIRDDNSKGYRYQFEGPDCQGEYSWGLLDKFGEIMYADSHIYYVQGAGDMLAFMNPIKVEVLNG